MWLQLSTVLFLGLYVLKYHLAGYTAAQFGYLSVLFGVYGVVCTASMALIKECAAGPAGTPTVAMLITILATCYDTFKGGRRGAQATAVALLNVHMSAVRASAWTQCTVGFGCASVCAIALVVLCRPQTVDPAPYGRLNAIAVLLCLHAATVYELPLLVAVGFGALDHSSSYFFAMVSVVAAAANPVEPPLRVLAASAVLGFAAV